MQNKTNLTVIPFDHFLDTFYNTVFYYDVLTNQLKDVGQ